MQRDKLEFSLYPNHGHNLCGRVVFRTNHGRRVYLSVSIENEGVQILQCWYADRNRYRIGQRRFSSIPQKLTSHPNLLSASELLRIIEVELDKKFSSLSFMESPETAFMTSEEFVEHSLTVEARKRYHLLIFVAQSNLCAPSGLPAVMATRLKNQLHRTIYLRLKYVGDDKGVIEQCHFYDRPYLRDGIQVTPSSLFSVFFPYQREEILKMVNGELVCMFDTILTVPAAELDIEGNTTPLCGAV